MSSSHDILQGLTEAQRQAVTHVHGPLLILAGPGSGKTRVVTHRMAYLLDQGIPAHQIVGLTFTNKAADEMAQRLDRLRPGRRVWVGTFHRFCASLLRRYADGVGLEPNFTIYDTEASKKLFQTLAEHTERNLRYTSADQLLQEISRAKNRLVTPEGYRQGFRLATPELADLVSDLYPMYQRALRRANAVDFDDLLMYAAMLLHGSAELRRTLDARYQFLLVDEYQDTNFAQYAVVRALSTDYPNLAATGDPDQSIYGWRGANLGNILEFERDFPAARVVRLEQNYRSTQRICRIADELIAHNRRRKNKRMVTENDLGPPVRLVLFPTGDEEAEQIANDVAQAIREGARPRDIAIFYRINALSRAYEQALRDHAIPYQIVHGIEFYQRKEVKDCLAYLQLINNPRDEVALRRIINLPPRKIGKRTVDRLADAAQQQGITLLEAARRAGLVETLSKGAAVHVARFVALYDRLSLLGHRPVEEILGHVLSETGLRDYFRGDDREDEERLANVEELLSAARLHDAEHLEGEGYLESFLEKVALVNDTDNWENDADRVTLMTLHAAKGLEFPQVYIVAVEQGLLPHDRSRQDPEGLEEERRLLFVGMTRARERLQLSVASFRTYRGNFAPRSPSEFLLEMPTSEMEVLDRRGAMLRHRPPSDGAPDAESGQPSRRSWAASSFSSDPTSSAPLPLTTAAAMLQAGETRPLTRGIDQPDAFQLGMAVSHPEYGLGKIVALSGQDPNRTATVNFATGAGQRKFVLSKSPLRPVRS